jgi:hypothetical protein
MEQDSGAQATRTVKVLVGVNLDSKGRSEFTKR